MSDNEVPPSNDIFSPAREKMRQSIKEITAELNSALVAAGLACPVYICVPSSGDSIATYATSLDPNDAGWNQITDIVREIVGKRIGATRLLSRPLACAMAGVAMAGADVIVG
jgi:hypothetical protein